ncbi:MAG: hypothetical protein JEZ07_19780 [Phycisphaerae bacterium]|nr:hypothetical protein [Phycisphaerae bacterium]MBI9019496.1 hypothetical protein [Phycisphaerae bacterium]
MDFELANEYALRILQGEAKLHEELVTMCIPRLLYLRNTLGFRMIPEAEVVHELAADAVADALFKQETRKLPFTICLHNTFRDLCRSRKNIIRDRHIKDLFETNGIRMSPSLTGGKQPEAVEVQVQNNEIFQLAKDILEDHEPFSKKVVIQKSRGFTYLEMAKTYDKEDKECKRVYWHDMNQLRAIFNSKANN